MEILKIVITILFVIDCIALSAVVLMQEGKSAGLGTIAGIEFKSICLMKEDAEHSISKNRVFFFYHIR